MRQTSVLICGGGPVGPTASIPLSDLGIPNVVVKKRPSTTQLPRAAVCLVARSANQLPSLTIKVKHLFSQPALSRQRSRSDWQ
jgi:2-polyprenyl-6-methoxyphenol hydroxylase-like FAD-dependent oxidoreductase